MNQKIEKIKKELAALQTKKNNAIDKLKGEVAEIESNLGKCQADMKKAVEKEDLAGYQAAATKKSYYESRLEIVTGKLEATKAEAPAGSYDDTRAAIIAAFEESQANLEKTLVKDALKLEAMEQAQRAEYAEAEAVLNMLNDLYNTTGEGKKQFSIMDYNNVYAWATSVKRSPVFGTVIKAHPEYAEK